MMSLNTWQLSVPSSPLEHFRALHIRLPSESWLITSSKCQIYSPHSKDSTSILFFNITTYTGYTQVKSKKILLKSKYRLVPTLFAHITKGEKCKTKYVLHRLPTLFAHHHPLSGKDKLSSVKLLQAGPFLIFWDSLTLNDFTSKSGPENFNWSSLQKMERPGLKRLI